ncbi:DUF6348 family protein [Hymenobacter sp. CRA2]|uniref:DUF6348 family protein n=1 Tax=Hymenobacter sp. CRA2 TaxID=1955620 RepID=UPI00098F39F5|nr:DUF6348 family protein [Hymenobacter sp. CRA2]OON65867.1 hypothetical protein B0919_22830 [Hymenobacter sp. CRA2]
MLDINCDIQILFQNHGVGVVALADKALLLTRTPALVWAQVVLQEYPDGVSSQLDVRLDIGPQMLIESFGDVGEDAESAVQNNLRNFAHNSFHVLLAALQQTTTDKQIDTEEWTINGRQWRVYMGNYGIKSLGGQPVTVPQELVTTLESIIRQLPLTQPHHWFRLFLSCHQRELTYVEFLMDNAPVPTVEEQLRQLDWQLADDFYSVRLFLMLQQLPTGTA